MYSQKIYCKEFAYVIVGAGWESEIPRVDHQEGQIKGPADRN